MLKKKLVAMVVVTAMALSLLTGCSSSESKEPAPDAAAADETADEQAESTEPVTEDKERVKITVAYHPHITGVGGLLNAIDNGYFEEENLEVELVQFTSGATELQAMASGEIDLGYLGVGAHVFAPQGQCVILALDSTDMSGEIMTRADSGIASLTDL